MNFNFNKGQQHVTSLGQVPRILNREYYASLAPCFLRRARLVPLASDCSAMIVLPRAIVVGPTILLSAKKESSCARLESTAPCAGLCHKILPFFNAGWTRSRDCRHSGDLKLRPTCQLASSGAGADLVILPSLQGHSPQLQRPTGLERGRKMSSQNHVFLPLVRKHPVDQESQHKLPTSGSQASLPRS